MRRPLFTALALAAGLCFTDVGHSVLRAVKVALTGDSASSGELPPAAPPPASSPTVAKNGRIQLPEVQVLAPKAESASSASARASAPLASAAPTPTAGSAPIENKASSEADETSAREQARLQAEQATRPSLPLRTLQATVPLQGTGLSEYLHAAASKGQFNVKDLPWYGDSSSASDKSSAYYGVWEGAFSGAKDGELAFFVRANGEYRAVVALENRSKFYVLRGTVGAQGQLAPQPNPLLPGLGLFTLQGVMGVHAKEAAGIWARGARVDGGTWFLRQR